MLALGEHETGGVPDFKMRSRQVFEGSLGGGGATTIPLACHLGAGRCKRELVAELGIQTRGDPSRP